MTKVPTAGGSMNEERWAQLHGAMDEQRGWELLRLSPIGRIAVTMAGDPEIFPVNHVVDHGTIVFRTSRGTKLAAVTLHPIVAYEADGYDAASGTAWSVVIKGRAVPVRNREELMDTLFLPLHPWHQGDKPYFVRVIPERATMREFHVTAASAPSAFAPRAPQE